MSGIFDVFFAFMVVAHSSAIGLGVGASTLAIAGFLTALGNDGKIDTSERRVMGAIYFSLRMAMAMIVLCSLIIWFIDPQFFGLFTVPMWIMVGVLFVNAFLMTKHWITPKLGPAIQAGTWYTLGFLITIYIFDFYPLTMSLFWSFYIADLVLAVIIVLLCMKYLTWRRSKRQASA